MSSRKKTFWYPYYKGGKSLLKASFRSHPYRLICAFKAFFTFLSEYKAVSRNKNPNFEHSWRYFWPCLKDRTENTPIDQHYFYQDTWAINKITLASHRASK